MIDVLEAQRIRRPAMQKISTVQAGGRSIFNADKLTRLYRTAELDRRVQVTATKSWLTRECGWKGGDRGGLAEWGKMKKPKRESKPLDRDRPSHGRTLPQQRW
jgi:hypothetical protein